jgi:hypothetical protein
MAGSKTRFGFLGNGDEPPNSGESGAARTIIGHDIHLPKLPAGFAQPGSPVSPTPIPPARVPASHLPPTAVRAPMREVITESVPVRRQYKPQKSRLARFLGHWTRGGHFHARSRMGDSAIVDDADDDDLDVPRDTTGRNVLLVLVIAALTFLVTFAVVKIRKRYASAPSVPDALVAEKQVAPLALPPKPAPVTQALGPTPAPVVAPVLAKTETTTPVAPAKPPTPSERPLLLGTPLPRAAVPPASQPRPFPHAATPLAKHAITPAGTATAMAPTATPRPPKAARPSPPSSKLPEHIKGELLPFGGQQ